jgi:DNA replication and repair protein RecF
LHIHVLQAESFRNLRQVSIEPHVRFNILHGDNGQGKTNLLEAIYFLATLRSFRTVHSLEELIRFDETMAVARARIERQTIERVIGVQLCAGRPPKKIALVDGRPARSNDYFGGCTVVLFTPEDLRLPKGSPAQRRRFLDRAVWNTCPAYLKEVQTYERILKSRNALLRGEQQHSPAAMEDLLQVYDEQLATSGAQLGRRRREFLQRLDGWLTGAFARISQSGLQAGVRYESSFADEAELRDRLQRDRRRDIRRGFTHSGPHTDDLCLELSGRSAAAYASQGQIRALVLALKIAEIQQLYHLLGDAPVLLLDDVSSELDATRNAQLFSFLLEVPCQTFITTTGTEHIWLSAERREFCVKDGAIERGDKVR